MKLSIAPRQFYTQVLFFIFSFFFVSPILSPEVNGITLYLHLFIPIFDIHFLEYLSSLVKVQRRGLTYFLMFIAIQAVHMDIIGIIRVICIIYPLVYLYYIYSTIGFRLLYTAFNINIFVAILQFVLCYVNPPLAYMIGPTHISRRLWGAYSTATFTNFYSIHLIFDLVRTCGLSREAGFFASLLVMIFIIYIHDRKIKKTKYQFFLFAAGYIVSFSKMSFVLFFLLVFCYLKRWLDNVPPVSAVIVLLFALGIFAQSIVDLGYITPASSYSHRFFGYAVTLDHLTVKEIFLGSWNGVKGLYGKSVVQESASGNFLYLFPYDSFCGYPNLIAKYGYPGFMVFLALLFSTGIGTAELLFLIFATFNVDLLTTTSYVVLAYWFSIFLMKKSFSPSSQKNASGIILRKEYAVNG